MSAVLSRSTPVRSAPVDRRTPGAWMLTLSAAAALSACAHLPGSAPGSASASASPVSPAASAAAPPPPATASAPARPNGTAPAPAPAGAAPAPAPGAAPASALPPFAALIRDARRLDGTFTLWRKDDRVWIELAESDFGAPLFLSPKLKTGIGEAGLYGGLMASRWGSTARPQLVEFRRVFNQVQLLARNTEFVARAGTPEARAVAQAFSPSLVASAAVASQPHPERKTVLVEVNSLLMGDWMGLATQLQRAFRQGYGYDARNSTLTEARAKPDAVVIETRNHYATGAIAVAQPGAPAAAAPTTPSTLPDPRSLFIEIHYSLSRLPAQPMTARRADPRLGHFVSWWADYGDDLQRSPRQRVVNRWRLEKKDPTAALSEPVRPITFWIDPTVPDKYRASMTAGILEWNKAFEAIGFKNAIAVQVQTDPAAFGTLDTGVASVRWMTNAQPSFGAIGPSHVDPRSGEILDADIGFEALSSRALRAARSQIVQGGPAARLDWLQLMQASDALREAGPEGQALLNAHAQACEHGDHAAEQLAYALDLLQLQGRLEPGSAEVEAFVQAYIKDVTMHEVGHTLGLRHNFRASRAVPADQLDDPRYGLAHALTGSVMEYAAVNLPRPGQPIVVPFQTTLGAYDYWAIEYAYKPVEAAREAEELERIAARSAEPALAFGTDEDNYLGLDPESLQFDLGDDPVAFARRRIDIARDLLQRLETWPLRAGEDYSILRRVVSYVLRDLGRTAGILARQVGGVRTWRDFPGTGRDPLSPLPADRQRAALDLLAEAVFSPRALHPSPALLRRLAPDYLERGDALMNAGGAVATDYLPQQALLELQRGLLAQLMSDGVAQRLIDSAAKTGGAPAANASLRLSELYQRLDQAIWGELAGGARPLDPVRRELQRDHAERLAAVLLRPAQISRGDARVLLRAQARSLLARVEQAASRGALAPEDRAHLQAVAETLRDALNARLVRPA